MNCRLFSQHENYTTESQIVKLIYNIMILTARSMLLKSTVLKKIPMPKHEFPFIQVSLSPGYIIYILETPKPVSIRMALFVPHNR